MYMYDGIDVKSQIKKKENKQTNKQTSVTGVLKGQIVSITSHESLVQKLKMNVLF